MSAPPTVFVIDDDEGMRDSIQFLLESVGLRVACFASAEAFQATYDNQQPGCVLVDVCMPGRPGLELQKELCRDRNAPPVLLISGHGDIPMAVSALRAGAFDFIEKPYSDEILVGRIREALETDSRRREQLRELAEVEDCFARLTAREREVFQLVVDGNPNKVIAATLELSQKTVEVHRAHVMEKMEAKSLADLVKMAVRLEAARSPEARGPSGTAT